MADIQPAAAPRGGKSRARRTSLRLDMTPMVGLGLLLVSFFLLAADFSKPHVLGLNMPVKPAMDDEAGMGCHIVDNMTVVLTKGHHVYYYDGMNDDFNKPQLHSSSFSPTGLRRTLLARKGQNNNLLVMIKPTSGATYKDMVDVLDEMRITGQKKYALIDLNRHDLALLKQNSL